METTVNTEATERAASAMAEKQEEVLKEAIREGYNGVDFITDMDSDFRGSPDFSVSTKYKKWNTPPQYLHPSGIQRYDFRYHDRDDLTYLAEHGEWPE